MRLFERCDNWNTCKQYATYVVKSFYHGDIFLMCPQCTTHMEFDFGSNIEKKDLNPPKREPAV